MTNSASASLFIWTKSPQNPESSTFSFFCLEYKYGLDMLSWDGAETACQTWGGHLASVHSQTEMDLIINGFSAA